MKKSQLTGIGVAVGAGLLAMVGMQSILEQPATTEIVRQETVGAVRVLVAQRDIGLGETTTATSFRWQDWPRDSVPPSFITAEASPDAMDKMANGVVRSPILAGEPITATKIVHSGQGGVLAALLPAGKRAASTKIDPKSAAGKMVLPNDRVDVILTMRKRRTTSEDFQVKTLFTNIRVLAIGQTIEVKDNKLVAEGDVATLELSPEQAEQLALATSVGEISLALRSVADIAVTADDEEKARKKSEAVSITRYGSTSDVGG